MEPGLLFDPFTGQQVDTQGNIIEGGVTFNEVAPEGFRTFEGTTPGIVYPGGSTFLGTQGPFQVIEVRSGHYEIISETRLGLINVQAGTQVQRMVSGTVTVYLGGVEPEDFEIGLTRVAPTDRQWIAYQQNDGTVGFTTVRGPYRNDAEVQRDLGVTARLATGEEAAYASIMKELIKAHEARLQEIAEENGLESDSAATTIYKAARLVMSGLDMSQIHSFSASLAG